MSDEATPAPFPDHVYDGTDAPDPVRDTAPKAPRALDDTEGDLDDYLKDDLPAVMPVGGMAAGTVPRAPRDEEDK